MRQVFLLYTLQAAPTGRTGLGQVDPRHDLLVVRFDLDDDGEDAMPEVRSTASSELQGMHASSNRGRRRDVGQGRKLPTQGKKKQYTNKADQQRSTSSTIEILLYQDSTSLQSTEGDTGSVIWRSSLRLGTSLCRQIHKPLYGQPALLNASALLQQGGGQPTTTTVLELGSGTGILPLTLLSALPATAPAPAPEQGLRWIATDQQAMLHLLRKNVDLTRDPRLRVAPLDWCEVSQRSRNKSTYAGGVDGLRRDTMEWRGARQEERGSDAKDGWPDLIIAVDCVFK